MRIKENDNILLEITDLEDYADIISNLSISLIEEEMVSQIDMANLQSQFSKSITELTETVKDIQTSTSLIPSLVNRLEIFEKTVKEELADLKGRVLLNEEAVEKIHSVLNKQIGTEKLSRSKAKISEENLTSLENKVDTMFKSFANNNNNCKEQFKELNAKYDNIYEELQGFKNQLGERNTDIPRELNESSEKVKENYKDAVFNNDVILITDSNGKRIVADKLAKGHSCKRILCYTFNDVKQLIHQVASETPPKKILISVGTNDIEHSGGNATEVFAQAEEVITSLRKNFPSTRIYISSIFPRKKGSGLNPCIDEFNQNLHTMCDITPNLTFMNNPQLTENNLMDEKHLNGKGLFLFLSNIRFHLFGQFSNTGERRGYRGKGHRPR